MSDDDGPTTIQSELEDAAEHDVSPGVAAATAPDVVADPVALLRHLDVSGRFHRDGRIGRIYHPGMVSLRENVTEDSLHVSVDGNRVQAHVDAFSPLTEDARGRSRYSPRGAIAHNLVGATHDLIALLRGRQGDHACELDCEWITEEEQAADTPDVLLDPAATRWSVHLDVRVAGSLDPARLRKALGDLAGDHGSADDRLEVVDCADDEALGAARARLQSLPVPIAPPPPLRACLARHAGGDVLMLNLNHAACDGFGAVAVLRRIAAGYVAEDHPVAPLAWLASRKLPVRPSTARKPAVLRVYGSALEQLRNALARPARLAAEGASDEDGYGFHLVALSADETRKVGRGEGSPHDRHAPMAALHLAIGTWNRRHGAPGGTVGVLAPADLRPDGWDEETIGNFSVVTRVSTSRIERRGARSVLKAIRVQIARTKRTRSGIALMEGLRRAGLLNLWAKQSIVVLQPLASNRFIDTAMLCNLGWVDDPPAFGREAGETIELWFSPPSRSPLSLCVGTVTLEGRLHLTFRYPHRLFDHDAACRFADCYVERLRDVAECCT